MKIKDLCDVMFDNEDVEIYDSKRKLGLIHRSTAARLRLDREWKDKEVYTIEPYSSVMIVYLGC